MIITVKEFTKRFHGKLATVRMRDGAITKKSTIQANIEEYNDGNVFEVLINPVDDSTGYTILGEEKHGSVATI